MKKSEQEHVYKISPLKLVTKKFLEVSRCSRPKQRQRNVQKKCAAPTKLFFFFAIRPIVVFHRSAALPSPLSITRFYILFEETINTIESFALAKFKKVKLRFSRSALLLINRELKNHDEVHDDDVC